MPSFFAIAPVKEANVVYEVLANIDILFANADTASSIHTLAELGAVIGLLVACIRGIFTQKLEIHVVFVTIVLYMALMVPRVSLEVRDGEMGGPLIGVVQLPIGIAATASIFSTISDGLTTLYNDYVTTPTGWTISPNESWKMIDGMRKAVSPSVMDSKLNGGTVPFFANNIREYVKRCVVEDIQGTTASDAGRKINAMLENNDVFLEIESMWGWRLATWIDTAGVETVKTCPDYYTALQTDWNNPGSWNEFQQEAARILVGNENLSSQVRLSNAHYSAVQNIMSAGENALDFMKKLYLQNHIVSAASETPLGIETVKILADAKYDTLYRSTADATLWSEVVWKYATVIWVLVIALLPFLSFFLFLGSGGIKLFTTFLMGLAWVSLWNPLAAVLQSILAISYSAAISELLGVVDPGSIKAKMLYYNELAEWISTGNYLMMSVPVIALFILTGSTIAANSLISKMSSDSSVDTSAATVRQGSFGYGNASAFNMPNGMVGTSAAGATDEFNQTVSIGNHVAASGAQAVTAAREADETTQQSHEELRASLATKSATALREDSAARERTRVEETASQNVTTAGTSSRDTVATQSGSRETTGMTLNADMSHSAKRAVGALGAQSMYKQLLKGKGAGGGAGSKLLALGGAAYALVPDVGLRATGGATSTDEASNTFATTDDVAETDVTSFAEGDRQSTADTSHEAMKSGYGLSTEDKESLALSKRHAHASQKKLAEMQTAQQTATLQAGSSASFTRRSFMNNAQNLSRQQLRQVPGVAALMDTPTGQKLMEDGGPSEFAFQAVDKAAQAGDIEMAEGILNQTGFDQAAVKSFLGGAGIKAMGDRIGDGKLSAEEFEGVIDFGGSDQLSEQVAGGSKGVQDAINYAEAPGTQRKAPGIKEQGVIRAAANAGIEGMETYLGALAPAATRPVEDKVQAALAAGKEKLAAGREGTNSSENWLENVNTMRAEAGLTPISTGTMGAMQNMTDDVQNGLERYLAPEKALENTAKGVQTLTALERGQSIIENIDQTKLRPGEQVLFGEFKQQISDGLSAAQETGAIGGIALPEADDNIDIGKVDDTSKRINAINAIGAKHGDEAMAAFGGLAALAQVSGQGDVVAAASNVEGDYSRAIGTLTDNMGELNRSDMFNVDGATATLVDGIGAALFLGPETSRKIAGAIEDGAEWGSEKMTEEIPNYSKEALTNNIEALRDSLWGDDQGPSLAESFPDAEVKN